MTAAPHITSDPYGELAELRRERDRADVLIASLRQDAKWRDDERERHRDVLRELNALKAELTALRRLARNGDAGLVARLLAVPEFGPVGR